MTDCPRCGEPLPDRARFCPNCGTSLTVPAASERRVVTVVFVDLADSTELASTMDPERFREVLFSFHTMVTEEIEWLGGQAERFIGDAVLGVFGAPVARDDDAVRAIRAAISIIDRAERLGRQLGLAMPMRVRIGINTGPVALGTPADRNLVIGAEVNAGARRQQAAAPGEILVGPTTHQLAARWVEFGEVREVSAKGFDGELLAWPVLRFTDPRPGRRTRFVNRRRELTLLGDTFERASGRDRAHLVTLLGEPGIGKSRVVEEFLDRLPDEATVLIGRSSPFEEAVTFWPLAEMVYGLIGESRSSSEERIADGLRRLVAPWAALEELERAVHGLSLTLGIGEEGTEENRYHAAEVRASVLTLLAGLAGPGPVVMVFEDLQEADPLLLDLIEQLVKDARRLPLLVICVARWDFLEDRPSWAGGIADAVTLWVEPLGDEASAQLAMAAGGLTREEAERVVAQAGGNPLFIVEITGMLARERREGAPRGRGSRLLPATVQAVVAARLDQLSAETRELVRRASVFPRGRFDLDELALVIEPRRELLAEAEDDELLERDPDRQGMWRFRSDVLRDVAYESLAKRERQRLHLRVADRLSAESPDRYPRTIAFHLEQAARAALDLSPGDRSIADRALDALAAAGDIARRGLEFRAGADLYERALALAGSPEGWGVREAWPLSALGECRYWLGEFEDAEASLERAADLGDEIDRVAAHANRYLADIALTVRGDDTRAAELFDRALRAARRLDEPFVLSRTLLMAGWVPYWRNDLGHAAAIFSEALEVARSRERPDPWAEARALVGLANVESARGSERRALEIVEEALSIGRAAGQAFTAAVAAENVAASLRRLMRLDEALTHADAAVSGLRELGARWELASALGDRGSIHRMAGRMDEAERDLREAFVLCRDLRERALVTWTAAELARTLSLRGEPHEARLVLNDPVARTAEGEPGSATALLAAESVTALAEGDLAEARVKAKAAVDVERGPTGVPNAAAAWTWFAAELFGPDIAGGPGVVREAQERLERNGWLQALAEPDLVRPLLAAR